MTNVITALKKGETVIIPTKGVSMQPLLYDKHHPKATLVKLSPISFPVKRGTLLLAENTAGDYVLHRLYMIQNDIYYTQGDNTLRGESFSETQLIGQASAVYRKGKWLDLNSRSAHLYDVFIRWSRPLRVLLLRVKNKLKKLGGDHGKV